MKRKRANQNFIRDPLFMKSTQMIEFEEKPNLIANIWLIE